MASILFPDWSPAAMAECLYGIGDMLEDKLWLLEGRDDWRDELDAHEIASLQRAIAADAESYV